MKLVTFRNFFAPGDCLVSTAALRDLHLTYPFEYQVSMQSCYPEVFFNNPHIDNRRYNTWGFLDLNPFDWKSKNQDNGSHYSEAYYHLFEEKLMVNIKRTSIFPEIYLTDEEKSEDILSKLEIKKPYWVINSGFKNDIPLKQYPAFLWQQAVNKLKVLNAPFDLVQSGHSHHNHIPLHSVKNLIGKTDNIRDYFSLIYHSEGVICHVSFPMHIAAAFHKPCVVIAGGRENFRWEQYPGHQYLHTIGKLDCCRESGCWKANFSECSNFSQYPSCYEFITPEDVVRAVLGYQKLG